LEIRVKVWLEENGAVLFGDGRLKLMEAVERAGSLAAAAKELKMSYRAAWGRLRASEERLGFALVERSQEGRRSMRLTQAARDIMSRYAELKKAAQGYLDQHMAGLEQSLTSARRKG